MAKALRLHCIATELSGTIRVDLSYSTASCREGGGKNTQKHVRNVHGLALAPRKDALLVKHISSVASLKVLDNPYVKKFGGCPYPTVCYKIGRQVATCQIECW